MRVIEPCCAPRHLRELRDSIGDNGKTEFQGFGDLSLSELLPALLKRYSETEMMIVAPTLPDQAADIIHRWMNRQWARMDGKGKLNVIERLTIVADLSAAHSPVASGWCQHNPLEGRLTLIDRIQSDTVILLPDIAIKGPLNLQYGRNFICTVTTIQEEVNALWKQYSKMTRRQPKKKQMRTPSVQESPSDISKQFISSGDTKIF